MKQMWTERIRIIALLALAIVSQAVGNVLLSQGMKLIAGESQLTWSNWVAIFLQAVQSPSILLGVGFYVIFFVLFAAALSRADLSFVLPAISSEVVINVAFADCFLNETVSSIRWIGALLISIGVGLVVRSSPRTFGIASGQDTMAEGSR
jgi:drug/metabolite transporter (DMT)-like permease